MSFFTQSFAKKKKAMKMLMKSLFTSGRESANISRTPRKREMKVGWGCCRPEAQEGAFVSWRRGGKFAKEWRTLS